MDLWIFYKEVPNVNFQWALRMVFGSTTGTFKTQVYMSLILYMDNDNV